MQLNRDRAGMVDQIKICNTTYWLLKTVGEILFLWWLKVALYVMKIILIYDCMSVSIQFNAKTVFIASVVRTLLLLWKMTYIYLRMKCCNYKSHRWSNTLQRANRGLTRHALNTEQYFECRCWAKGCLWLHRDKTLQSKHTYIVLRLIVGSLD